MLSLFRILLVPECCVIKLACTVLSFLSKPWVDCIKGYREQTVQGRDLVFIVYATIRVSEIKKKKWFLTLLLVSHFKNLKNVEYAHKDICISELMIEKLSTVRLGMVSFHPQLKSSS